MLQRVDTLLRSMAARPRWIVASSLLVAVAVILLVWPVLAAPVNADERYWYMAVPGYSEGSYPSLLARTLDEIPAELDRGRFDPLANLGRRVATLAGTQWAVGSATPVVVVHGILKLVMLAAGIAISMIFLRTLRWRAVDGSLVRFDRGALIQVLVATTALIVVGAQAHDQFRNGWTAYPLLTYGATTVVLGTAALLVHVARRMAEERRAALPVAVTVAAVAGIVLNGIYELYYLAAPFAVLMVVLAPLAEPARHRIELRAKRIAAGVFGGAFAVTFVVVRWLTGRCTAGGTCYEGTELSLGLGVIRTATRNLLSTIPGVSHQRITADLDRLGETVRWFGPAEVAVLAAAAATIAIVVLWYAGAPRPRASFPPPEPVPHPEPDSGRPPDLGPHPGLDPAPDPGPDPGTDLASQRRLALFAAAAALLVALGEATIMALSVQAQEIIDGFGLPYRHTVVTWMSLALATALGLRALGLVRPPWGRLLAATLLVVVVVGAAVYTYPRNLAATRGYRLLPSQQSIEALHWQVIIGDPSAEGDERRCRVFEQVEATNGQTWVPTILRTGVEDAYRHFHGAPFCSEWAGGDG